MERIRQYIEDITFLDELQKELRAKYPDPKDFPYEDFSVEDLAYRGFGKAQLRPLEFYDPKEHFAEGEMMAEGPINKLDVLADVTTLRGLASKQNPSVYEVGVGSGGVFSGYVPQFQPCPVCGKFGLHVCMDKPPALERIAAALERIADWVEKKNGPAGTVV